MDGRLEEAQPQEESATAASATQHDSSATGASNAATMLTPAQAARLLIEAGVLVDSGKGHDSVRHIERLSGGNTNIIYRVDTTTDESFLLRIFGQGTEALIDRAQEARCFHAVSARGLGPRLLGGFAGGRVEEYIHGRALTAAEMRDPAIAAAIARHFRALHSIDQDEGLPSEQQREPQLFAQLRAWARLALEQCGPLFEGVDMTAFPAKIERLQARLLPLQSPVCLCHNDLNHTNILLLDPQEQQQEPGSSSSASRGPSVVFVDLEYAGRNYRGFDLGNHLCEYASDFLQPSAHRLDFGRYPCLAARRAFARAYLGGAEEEGREEEEVDALVREMDEFALASHLYWGIWGLVQARISNIATGFDYGAYARQRLEEYWKGMKEAS